VLGTLRYRLELPSKRFQWKNASIFERLQALAAKALKRRLPILFQ
jgi:hypothetical protein